VISAIVYGARSMRWEWIILLGAVIALDPSPYWGLVISYMVFLGHEAFQGTAAGWMYWVFKKNAQRAAQPTGEGVISTEAGRGVTKRDALDEPAKEGA
jgi:hypothetical protein